MMKNMPLILMAMLVTGCATHRVTPTPLALQSLVAELNSVLPRGWHADVNKQRDYGAGETNIEVAYETPVLAYCLALPNGTDRQDGDKQDEPFSDIFYFNFYLTGKGGGSHEYRGTHFYLFDSRQHCPMDDTNFDKECDVVLGIIESRMKRLEPPFGSVPPNQEWTFAGTVLERSDGQIGETNRTTVLIEMDRKDDRDDEFLYQVRLSFNPTNGTMDPDGTRWISRPMPRLPCPTCMPSIVAATTGRWCTLVFESTKVGIEATNGNSGCGIALKTLTWMQESAQPEDVGNDNTNGSIISVELAETVRGKGQNDKTFYVRLSITNTHDRPTWYITSYWGGTSLATNRPFKAIDPWQPGYEIHDAYNGDRFGGKGTFQIEKFIGAGPPGEAQHSFVAFRLPAAGVLTHDYFPIHAFSDIASMEIWEASELKVDGEVPLEDWLPYEVTSSAETHITRQAYWEKMNSGAVQWKEGKRYPYYAKQDVKSFVPTVILKRTVPIKGVVMKHKPHRPVED